MEFSSLENANLNDFICSHFSVRLYRAGEGHTFSLPALPYATLIYIQKGSVFFALDDGTSVSGTEKCILFLPMYVGYTASFAQDTDTQYISFDFCFCHDFSDNVYEIPSYAKQIMHDKDGIYTERFKDFIKYDNTNKSFRLFEQLARAMNLLADIFRDSDMSGHKNNKYARLKPAIQYIEENYSKEFTTNELAVVCAMNVSFFRTLFKDCIGLSPTEYKNRLRIRHAVEMLNAGTHNVTEAAIAVGIDDAHYFSRLFKRYTGTLPRAVKIKY